MEGGGTPEDGEGIRGWRARAGGAHTVLETKDGNFFAWGWNEYGNLGVGDTNPRLEPSPLVFPVSELLPLSSVGIPLPSPFHPSSPSSLPGIVDFFCSWHHSLLLLDDGTLIVWGYNDEGQLGTGAISEFKTPTRLVVRKGVEEGGEGRRRESEESESSDTEEEAVEGEPVRIVLVGCGYYYSWALSEDGDLFTWGDGKVCGHGYNKHILQPKQVRNIKFRLPDSKRREWAPVLYWLFLGKLDQNSEFFVFPVEIIYNFVQIKW
jgi:alpha-tubulin suppressor-like RCC1 family protein